MRESRALAASRAQATTAAAAAAAAEIVREEESERGWSVVLDRPKA